MQSRLGVAEVRGKQHNPIIVQWASAIGHPEVADDETSWCSICVASAALEAGLSTPAHNVRMMARSWLTWGVKVDPDDIQPGDVAIWSRGDPRGWQGHVNVVETVKPDGRVVCIGGNQSTGKGYDAVTRTAPQDARKALGFRRAVPATIPALRKAGSTEVRKGDQMQNAGWIVTVIPAAIATVKELLAPVQVPSLPSLPEQLSWYSTLLSAAGSVWELIAAHPWLAGTVLIGIGCVLVGRRMKAARLAKHEAGVPLSVEVAKLEAA
jgi:uncharacterized protein (TIGR02594 family)